MYTLRLLDAAGRPRAARGYCGPGNRSRTLGRLS
jgi:hypothetical protein